MENFNEYWELFVDKKDSIAKEIIAYYKTLDDREDGTELSEQCCAFFGKNILVNPYPTCQLLKLLAISNIPGKNNTIYEIATVAALQAFSDDQDDASKCYSILTNSLISVKAISNLKARIIYALEHNKIDLERLMLALFSRKSIKLLVNLLPELSFPLKQKWTSDALDEKQHFLNALLDSEQTFVHHTNYIRFIQQVILANGDRGSVSSLVESIESLHDQIKIQPYLTAYLLELQRCFLLKSALRVDEAVLPARDFSQHSTVIGILARARAKLVNYDFTTLFGVIRKNQFLIEQIAASFGEVLPPEDSEAMALIEIQVLLILFKAIEGSFDSQVNEISCSSNLDAQLKCLLKETDIRTFVHVTESIFAMLFTRAEMIPDGRSTTERKYFLCSIPLLNAVATSLKTIMITRKHSVAYQDASEQSKYRFQKLLDLVIDVCWRISMFDDSPLPDSNAHTNVSKSSHHSIQLTDLLSVQITSVTPVHENYWESSSASSAGKGMLFCSVESITGTDVGSDHRHRLGRYGTLPKHKPTRRHARPPLVAAGSSNSGGSNKDLQRQASLSIDARSESIPYACGAEEGDFAAVGRKGASSNKKAFTKLFASPETLAIMCLTNDKILFAKQIIDNHNLHDLMVGRVVQRIEQMQALKSNLISLVEKYDRKQGSRAAFGGHLGEGNSDTLLDDIRFKTGEGFEIAKVLSTIETYLKSLPMEVAATHNSIIQPMDRFMGRYPFLSVQTGKNLQLSQVVDAVLSLPFKYELNLAIYNFLLKNAKPSASVSSSMMSTSMTGAGAEMSQLVGNYVAFFGTLMDTLQIAFRTTRTGTGLTEFNLTIGHLLSREVCTLNAVENGVVLKRRARFYSTIERLEEHQHMETTSRSLALLSDSGSASLGRMKQYLMNLTNLIQLLERDENVQSSITDSKHVDELIQMDLRMVLLQGLFEKKTPFTILEAFAAKLSINVVATIAERLLSSKVFNDDNPGDGLWQFIASKSELLRRLCQIQFNESPCDGNGIWNSLILQYTNLRNRTLSNDSRTWITCNRKRPDGQTVQTQELFPLKSHRTCCLLQARLNEDPDRVARSHISSPDCISIEQKAAKLLVDVDLFANASEWISASDHLLTAIRTKGNEEQVPVSPSMHQQLEQKANQLRTYLHVGNILRQHLPPDARAQVNNGWRSIQSFSESNKTIILQQLIERGEYQVCAEWIKLHPIDAERELEMFMYAVHRVTAASSASERLLDSGSDTPMGLLFAIIETMPVEAVVKLYQTMMLNIRSVPVVDYMLGYLERYGDQKSLYQKYAISLRIFEHLSRDEYDGLWNLASRPLLIIEQCLMNSRLELLAVVIRSIRPLLVEELCRPCYEHREYIRDLHDAVSDVRVDQLALPAVTTSRRNPVHDGLFIGHECLDCLLRVYAGKALEYKVFPEVAMPDGCGDDEAASRLAMASHVSSYDSLSEVACPFVIPKEIPRRERWVKDEDALHCMGCRRTFSMLNRRHHCRRCGRVVCHSCSKRKERLRDFYEDVAVRVCDDCWQFLKEESLGKESTEGSSSTASQPANVSPEGAESLFEWQLTGNERYDNVIRGEYSYEYAPSTGQCLTICNLHTANEEITAFLLYHCAKLEALLRPLHPGFPNPEIDYALVARMLLNLTLGVKVRGGGTEVEKMKEHAEIILSIVHDNCESLLLHTSSMSNHGSLRKLRDALVKAEKWTLALELSLKCGFSLNGVMAAWGMTCLRAGCYGTAREKFSHCLPRVASETECDFVLRMIEAAPTKGNYRTQTVPVVKRPARCPPLLNEILYALAYTASLGAPSERVMARINAAKQHSTFSGFRGVATGGASHEPAMNILSTLANLRNTCQGEFAGDDGLSPIGEPLIRIDSTSIMNSRLFEESLHYLLTYGSHQSIVAFLVRYRPMEVAALRYILWQHVDPEVFLQAVLLPYMQRGALETFVQRLTDIDETLLEWRDYIRYVCRYLEMNDMLNSLYNLQLLLKDPIRASMTCVRFYIAGCRTFGDLHASEHHLKTSVTHLQNELELCNWQEVRLNSTGSAVETHRSLLMKLDPKELNNHINTILLQLEVTKFLATCETRGRQTVAVLPKIFREMTQLPTLFGSSQEKLQLAILTLVCGQNVEEAFGLSYRIIQDYNLDTQRVYALTAKYFITHGKIEDVSKLLDAIVGNGVGTATEPVVSSVCDEIVRVSVDVALARHGVGVHTKVALQALINRASSVAVRIHCYVMSGQLKAAYLLANRHHRTGDIRKILRQAELLGQSHVKRLCETRLHQQEEVGGDTPVATDR